MSVKRVLLVVGVVALIIVSCLVGLYIAALLRRQGIFPRRNRNIQGADPSCPVYPEQCWPQAAQYPTPAPIAYGAPAAMPLTSSWQYPAPSPYAAQQGPASSYPGQPWTPQYSAYPGQAPKNTGPLFPI
ncbi:hypothetical protein V5799_033967 [Amblyomma americanum]|uniref:Uncharacterized protein n=1 Tax=Amblyomma americanum TaxID=6943 RepID=A0AAQ4DLT6_AMBAM